jgi:signal peptidase I
VTTATMTPDDAAHLLRSLAERAAPTITCPPDMARRVLSRHRRNLIIRRAGIAAGTTIVVGALAAGAWVGHSRYFGYYQPSDSMAPTLVADDTAILDRTLNPQRGDVVLISVRESGTTSDVLKRVIGLPGDSVACPADSSGLCSGVEVNGIRLNDSYLAGLRTAPFAVTRVSTGALFLLGDNRGNSVDSRNWGPLPATSVKGVVVEIRRPDQPSSAVPGAPTHDRPRNSLIDPIGPVPPAASVPGPNP